MHLSLIQRITLGFITVTLFVLAISTSAYLSQVSMSKQLKLTASTLTGLLDRSNVLTQHLQDVNRSMLVHANSEQEARRTELRLALGNAKQSYGETVALLETELSGYPQLVTKLNNLDGNATVFINGANQHLDIHDQRTSARSVATKELNTFDEEWLFFEQDINDLISDAKADEMQQVAWDLEFLLTQGKGRLDICRKSCL